MARVRVVVGLRGGHCLAGEDALVEVGNRFLEQLAVRLFSPATGRAYAFDLANFAGFLADRSLRLGDVALSDLFGYLDWQSRQVTTGGRVVALRRRGPAPATMNRRIAAVRGLFEYLVMIGERADNPVPAARAGLRDFAANAMVCSAMSRSVNEAAAALFASRSGCRKACLPAT